MTAVPDGKAGQANNSSSRLQTKKPKSSKNFFRILQFFVEWPIRLKTNTPRRNNSCATIFFKFSTHKAGRYLLFFFKTRAAPRFLNYARGRLSPAFLDFRAEKTCAAFDREIKKKPDIISAIYATLPCFIPAEIPVVRLKKNLNFNDRPVFPCRSRAAPSKSKSEPVAYFTRARAHCDRRFACIVLLLFVQPFWPIRFRRQVYVSVYIYAYNNSATREREKTAPNSRGLDDL